MPSPFCTNFASVMFELGLEDEFWLAGVLQRICLNINEALAWPYPKFGPPENRPLTNQPLLVPGQPLRR